MLKSDPLSWFKSKECIKYLLPPSPIFYVVFVFPTERSMRADFPRLKRTSMHTDSRIFAKNKTKKKNGRKVRWKRKSNQRRSKISRKKKKLVAKINESSSPFDGAVSWLLSLILASQVLLFFFVHAFPRVDLVCRASELPQRRKPLRGIDDSKEETRGGFFLFFFSCKFRGSSFLGTKATTYTRNKYASFV